MFLPSDITLRPGDSGEHVQALQERLTQRDLLAQANISGMYDGATEQAVREFQGLNGLLADGVAGPKTLRLLVSLASASAEGGASGDSQEEEKPINEERQDDLTLALEKQEQEKLANEAVWGPDTEGQQQLSDLDRYNDQHDKTQSAEAENQQAAMQERLDQQRSATHELEQLQIDADGVQATTPMDELNNATPTSLPATEQRQAEQNQAQTAQTNEPEIYSNRFYFDDAPEAPQASPPEAAKPPRDPEITRTEALLSQSAQSSSQQEGQVLDKNGIQNQGNIPIADLGDLQPAQTPAVQREREVGIT